MLKKPDISVIIPHYNQWEFLPDALESMRAQIYPPSEIIIVDDASDFFDESELQKAFPDLPLKIFRHETNRGVAAARNTGLKTAKGDYVALIDADDCWDKRHLAFFAEALKKNPGMQVYVAGSCYFCNECLPDESVDVSSEVRAVNYFDWAVTEPLAVNSSNIVLSREALETTGFFDEHLPVFEDIDYWIRLGRRFPVFVNRNNTVFLRLDTPGSLSKNLSLYRTESLEYFFNKHFEGIQSDREERFLHLNLYGIVLQYKKQGRSDFPVCLRGRLSEKFLGFRQKLFLRLPSFWVKLLAGWRKRMMC